MQFAKHWAAVLDDYVIDLGWSPDGTLLAAASAAGGISLYDAASGAVRSVLPGHEDGANCIAWLSNGLLASGGQDGAVRFWNTSNGEQASEAKLGNAWVEHLAWSSTLLFAAAGKKLVALNADGTVAHSFPDAPKTITALAYAKSPAPRIAAAYFGGVCTWDARDFSAPREYAYGNTIHALAWSPDGRWLVAGCQDNAVHLWAPAEDLELHMSGYETKLKELSFSHDSKWLATGGGRDACVWDCTGAGPEGREPMLLPHVGRVSAVAFQNSHSLLATAAASGEFALWAPTRKNPMIAEVKMPSPATRFAWRGDDSLLAVGTEKGSLFVFKT
jgi:WD40 repeat protein